MEEKDKFIIERVKPQCTTFKTVQIWSDTFEKLKSVSDENNIRLCQLIDDMVTFCMERLEVVEVEEAR